MRYLCGGWVSATFILKTAVTDAKPLRHARCAGCSGRTDNSPIGWLLAKPFVLSRELVERSKNERLFAVPTAVFRLILAIKCNVLFVLFEYVS